MIKELFKRVVPHSIISMAKDLKRFVSNKLLYWIAQSGFSSSLYYSLLPNVFGKECQRVIHGMLKYDQELHTFQQTQYRLRRNIHGIEKGLAMRPRHDVFAAGYIEETVMCYERALLNKCPDAPYSNELLWAHDVLHLYFNVVATHPSVDRAKQRFASLSSASLDEGFRTPYKRDLSCPPPVSYELFLDLARRRRSVRWYLPKPVPRELIDKAMLIVSLSPSACNRQPFEFRIFDDPELVQQVSSLPDGTVGFYHNFPVIVVIVGKLRAYSTEQDRHLVYIDGSLAAMSFMYALETLELSSCAINWHDVGVREKKLSGMLGMEPDECVIMLISVGYPDPDGMVAYSQKKELHLLRRYNLDC